MTNDQKKDIHHVIKKMAQCYTQKYIIIGYEILKHNL